MTKKRLIVQSKNLIQTKIFIHHSMNGLFVYNCIVCYGFFFLRLGGTIGMTFVTFLHLTYMTFDVQYMTLVTFSHLTHMTFVAI